MQIIITVSKSLKKPMSHTRRFRFLLNFYLAILLQLRLATRPMTCANCLSHETHVRSGAPNGRGPRFLEPAEPPIPTPLFQLLLMQHSFHHIVIACEVKV